MALWALGLAAVGYLGFVAGTLHRAAGEVTSARAAISVARDSLQLATATTTDPAPFDAALADVQRARRRLASRWLLPLRPLPVIGRQLASGRALTTSAASILQPVVDGLHELLALPPQPSLATRVAGYTTSADRTVAAIESAVGSLDLGPEAGLVGPLRDARREMASDVTRLRPILQDLATGMRAMDGIVRGQRRYLIIGGTNTEMGAGAPIPLARGLLTSDDGAISVGGWSWGSQNPLPKGQSLPTPPGPLTDLWSFLRPARYFQEVTQTPSFTFAAPLAVAQYESATGTAVDGVMVLDAEAMLALADLSGPVEIGGAERSGDALRRFIMHDQYELPKASSSTIRHDALLDLTEAVFNDILKRGDDVSPVLSTLFKLGSHRHVLFWSSHADEQHTAHALGVDGALGDDAAFVALSNRGANKLDNFVDIRASISRNSRPDGVGTVTIDVTVRNNSPTAGEPKYVIGPNTPHVTSAGEYAGYLTLYAPRGANGAAVAGDGPMIVDGYDDGHPVVGRLVRIKAGEQWTGQWTFELPTTRRIVPAPSGRAVEVVWKGH